jgi:hypothetical protein
MGYGENKIGSTSFESPNEVDPSLKSIIFYQN